MKCSLVLAFLFIALSSSAPLSCDENSHEIIYPNQDQSDDSVSLSDKDCPDNTVIDMQKLQNSFPNVQTLTITGANFTSAINTNTKFNSLTNLVIENCGLHNMPLTSASLERLTIDNCSNLKQKLDLKKLCDTSFTEIKIQHTFLTGTIDPSVFGNVFDNVDIHFNYFSGPLPTMDANYYEKFSSNCFAYPEEEFKGLRYQLCTCEYFSGYSKQCELMSCYYDDGKCTSEKPGGLSTTMIAIIIAIPCFIVLVGIIIGVVIVVKRNKSNDTRADRYEDEPKTDAPAVEINNLESSNVTAASVF